MADASFIQERGLTSSGRAIFTMTPKSNVMSCIYVRDCINALTLLELCSRDATVVGITCQLMS
jgi:hypothetical protein